MTAEMKDFLKSTGFEPTRLFERGAPLWEPAQSQEWSDMYNRELQGALRAALPDPL
jgi:hypothetical protein